MSQKHAHWNWHREMLEGKSAFFAVAVTIVISIGGLVEILPLYTLKGAPEPISTVKPYTPLEQGGRDIYVSEGCYNCHSQQVRPFRAETLRYGPWSRGGEFIYDRPFQLGSRRIGPDLQRVGGKNPNTWHYEHINDPRTLSPGSIMPRYSWLYDYTYTVEDITASVNALRTLGHPYPEDIDVEELVHTQAQGIVDDLKTAGIEVEADRQIIALIAYLQRLGQDGRAALDAAAEASADASVGAQ